MRYFRNIHARNAMWGVDDTGYSSLVRFDGTPFKAASMSIGQLIEHPSIVECYKDGTTLPEVNEKVTVKVDEEELSAAAWVTLVEPKKPRVNRITSIANELMTLGVAIGNAHIEALGKELLVLSNQP